MEKDKAYLQHLSDAISDIQIFLENVTQNEFLKNKEKQYAVVRALEMIGEATKNLNRDFRAKHREIPWRDIAGMRNKLIYEYFGVKLELVWETVNARLPQLREQICLILEGIGEKQIQRS